MVFPVWSKGLTKGSITGTPSGVPGMEQGFDQRLRYGNTKKCSRYGGVKSSKVPPLLIFTVGLRTNQKPPFWSHDQDWTNGIAPFRLRKFNA